ncbi:hypothetical protein ACHQM5_016270 [Ranunculus cassubicifolius]
MEIPTLPPMEIPTLPTTIAPIVFACLTMLATISFLYFYAPYWQVRKVPGPPTIPFLGHLHLLAIYGPDIFIHLAKRYGPIFRFHLGRQPLVIVADTDLCREVAIKKFKEMPNRSVIAPLSGSPILAKGVAMARDMEWSTIRNTMTSLYQPTHISSQLPLMKSAVDTLVSNLSNLEQKEVNFSDLSIRLTTDTLGQSAFGIDFGLSKSGQHANNLASDFIYSVTELKMGLNASLSVIIGLLFPIFQAPSRQILQRIPWTLDWKLNQVSKKLTSEADDIVTRRSNECADRNQSKDFLTLILNAKKSEKASKDIFTADRISALCYEHFLAGSVSTSFALNSVLYLVSHHPPVEAKLLKEIDYFGPHIPTAEDLLQKFPYLNQVIKETMRVYFASPLNAREASRNVEIGGYFLPKGTCVWLAPGVPAKDPKHFPEPEQFKPERFDSDCEEEKQRHPYAFMPFGIGPRACMGQNFAMQELRHAVFHLYKDFIFRHSPNMEKPLALEYGIILGFKHGVKLEVIKRK